MQSVWNSVPDIILLLSVVLLFILQPNTQTPVFSNMVNQMTPNTQINNQMAFVILSYYYLS